MKITCGIYLYEILQKKFIICHATHASFKQWSIPKGLQEDNEEPYSAALRELKEETGIDAGKLHILSTHSLHPVKYLKQNKTLVSFLVVTDTPLTDYKLHCSVLVNNSFPEIDKWLWTDIDTMNKMVHESQQQNIPAIREMTASI